MDNLIEVVLRDRKIQKIVPRGDVNSYIDRRGERKFTYKGQEVKLVVRGKDAKT